MSEPDRVIVFVDYQNVYRRARAAFHDHTHDPHWFGQVDPVRLGQHLAGHSDRPRVLKQVRIYRGMPANKRDPRGYSASRRQIAAWTASPLVDVTSRILQYPSDWPGGTEAPREKGIDVALAVDLAVMGGRKEFDVAVLVSLDTDLKPSLEYLCDLRRARGWPRVEVAAWTNPDQVNRRLSVSGHNVFCHWIDRPTYAAMQDLTNYSIGSPART